MKTGLVIGTAKLYDSPGREFYIVHCNACDQLFHTSSIKDKQECINCHEEIQLNKLEVKP